MRQYPFIYSQRDAAWAANQLGTVGGGAIGQYGCLLTCHAMKAGYYGHEIKPDALNDIYTKSNLYVSGDLISDADIHAVFDDIKLTDTKDYTNIPADLNYIKQLAADPTLTVTLELDFDHDPNDGIQTHFVELHNYDGTTLTIFDPWYGTDDNFTLHYGTNIAQTIQKIAIYQGTPTAAPVTIDSATFQKLVTNSTSYDSVCDELGEPHNTAGAIIISDIAKLKSDKATAEQTIGNLNKQIPDLEGQISTLGNQVTNLDQQLKTSQDNQKEPNSGLFYKDLYNQAEQDLLSTRQTLADLTVSTNKQIAQLKNTSAATMNLPSLWKIVLSRQFKLS